MTPIPEDSRHGLQQWQERTDACEDPALAAWMRQAAAPGHALNDTLLRIFACSPYLTRLLLNHPDTTMQVDTAGPEAAMDALLSALEAAAMQTSSQPELMRHLRAAKAKAALLVALADVAGMWDVARVTAALTALAEKSLAIAVDHILAQAHARGDIELADPAKPSHGSGVIVLGMGKLGGRELNYSSDIDLIVLFEPGKLRCNNRNGEQKVMNKLAHELVTLMQERTPDGYVFRTDLRLRPDPASTPPAVSTEAAYYYYESVGQNWERAAMIKARPVAGDIAAGERFLKNIGPFMWRRNLDFAAINDIHSIKRQMDSQQQKAIHIKGHNIKLGHGGIREIEFFVQIHQLIWGGREPVLRTRGTCETLARLTEYGLVSPEQERILLEAYPYFRMLEHRLQMVADEQTHTMPDTDAEIARIARFMGYDNTPAFERELMDKLTAVHAIYASSFRSNEAHELGDEGNLVFTGTTHDPETLETLRHMGYQNPETISEIVMGWHHGSCRATRTKRARELLTELMPLLIKRLSETASADTAFLKFNDFLVNLPAGVQLFSLFSANPQLLGLIADIMGSAPTLAASLSRNPELLEAVLYEDFNAELPSKQALTQQLAQMLSDEPDMETGMDRIRNFRNEKQFQAGVQVLKGKIGAETSGAFLSMLADIAIGKTCELVRREFTKTYGVIEGTSFATIALGKLGSEEMTFASDIDLVFVYDCPDFELRSDGEKEFSPSVYYNRFAQRFAGALSAMGRTGRLYEVDTRLRPSGAQGLLAVSVQALEHYFDELAWTFEYMAFTKARVIIGSEAIREKLNPFIYRQLVKPRDPGKLRADVDDMRERIAKEHPAANAWDIKFVRGGLMDVDFIAQYLMLLHAPRAPSAGPGSALAAFEWLGREGCIAPETAQELVRDAKFLSNLYNVLRLCNDGWLKEDAAPEGLKKLLAGSAHEKDFDALRERLIQVEQSVLGHYIKLLSN